MQHAARHLDDLALGVVLEAGGVDREAGLNAAVDVLGRDLAGLLVHLDLGDGGARRAVVEAEGDAATGDHVGTR